MARFAVIDIGTNSIKFHIGERKDDGTWGVVVDRAAVVDHHALLGSVALLDQEQRGFARRRHPTSYGLLG